MSKRGNLTREQAVSMVGEAAVAAVERKNCEQTGCLGYCGARWDDSFTEWSASLRCWDSDGNDVFLTAYYYTTNEQDEVMAETGDGGSIDWEIEGFEVG